MTLLTTIITNVDAITKVALPVGWIGALWGTVMAITAAEIIPILTIASLLMGMLASGVVIWVNLRRKKD